MEIKRQTNQRHKGRRLVHNSGASCCTFSHLAKSQRCSCWRDCWTVLDAFAISSFPSSILPFLLPHRLFSSLFTDSFHLSLSSFHILLPYIYILGVNLLCGGKVIFSRIINHSSVSPLILPTDPNSSVSTPVLCAFPSLVSALLNQGALTIALE